MNANRIPADILGLIFARLDLRSLVSLALTCRRFLMLFSVYPSSTLFDHNWTFEHRHEFKIELPKKWTKMVSGVITYTGPPPDHFRYGLDAATHLKGNPYMVLHSSPRLHHMIKFAKVFTHDPIPTTSSCVDYYVTGDNHYSNLRRRYHVFRLTFDGAKRMYTQYHRNGQSSIVAFFDTYRMTSCRYFNPQGINTLACSLNGTKNAMVIRHYKKNDDLSVAVSVYDLGSNMGIGRYLSVQFPSEFSQVISFDYIEYMYMSKNRTMDIITTFLDNNVVKKLYVM